MLTRLNKEIEALEEKRKSNPTSTTITAAIENLQAEKELAENRMNERNKVLAETTPEVQDNTKKARNQTEVLTAVMPGFDAQLTGIKASTKSDADKLTEEIDLRKSLLVKLEKERKTLEKQLTKDPLDVTAMEEMRVVDAFISEQKRINAEKESDLANVKSGLPNVGSPISAKEKQIQIKNIAPAYNSDLTIRQNKTEEQITESLENEIDLNQRIISQLEVVSNGLNASANNASLQRENEVLLILLDENNQRIASLQNEKSAIQNTSITQEDKDKVIDALDPEYRASQQAISKNLSELTNAELENSIFAARELRSLIVDRIAALEDQNGAKEQREKAILESLLEDLQADIAKRQDILKERNSTMFSAEEKLNAINALSPTYTSTVSSVESSNLSDQEKKVALIDNEKQLMRRMYPAIEAQEKIVNDNTEDEQAKRQLALIEQLLSESQDRLKALDPNGIQSAMLAQAMVDQLIPDYSSRRSFIENDSKMNEQAKERALMNLEYELLEMVEESIFRLEDVIRTQNPSNTEFQEYETLNGLRNSLTASISEHKDRINQPSNDGQLNEKKERLIVEVMPDYNARIAAIGGGGDESSTSVLGIEKQMSIENELIQKLASEKERVTKQLKRNPNDANLQEEAMVIEQLLNEHENRITELASNKSQLISAAGTETLENIREKILGENRDVLQFNAGTLAEAKEQDQLLANYERELINVLSVTEAQLKKESKNQELIEQKDALQVEISQVKEKRRQVSVTIGELETERIVESETEDVELKRLATEKEQIEAELNSANRSPKEQKMLEKELVAVQVAEDERKVEIIAEDNRILKNDVQSLQIVLKQQASASGESNAMASGGLNAANSEIQRAERLQVSAENSKDPQEKLYLMEQSNRALESAESILSYTNNRMALANLEEQTGVQLDTRENLNNDIRTESNRINELRQELKEIEIEITASRGKEKEQLLTEQKSIVTEIKQREKVILSLEAERQELLINEQTVTMINDSAMSQIISQDSERQIASSQEYADYYSKAVKTLEVEEQIATLEAQLTEKKNAVRRRVRVFAGELTTERMDEMKRDAAEIAEVEKELNQLRSKQATLQTAVENEINLTEDMRLKMQNLVLRGIAPIERMAVLASLVALPANGLTISNPDNALVVTERRIPVNVKIPSGLVYRVQIGAFAKPIKADKFAEFTPVSGELLNNGITRYLAGYFNNSKRVVEARDQIKALGYADAFAVAYCDGKRITLAEARVLEANGTCVALGENELNMALAANTAISLGIDTSTRLTNIIERDLTMEMMADGDTTKKQIVQNYTYNQAPGAAPADAIEKVKGLFFTVQIGVYNKPVSSEVLYDLSPLLTVRLPNGQIRYSVGMFISLGEARFKKQEAIDRGAADAFVTAYFNGERITVAEAEKMLADRGNFATTSKLTSVAYPTTTGRDRSTTVKPKKAYDGIQIVSKKKFNDFPVDVLNRYNAQGSFYFDVTDKRVKSVIYPNEDALPQISYFKDDVDTLRILRSEFNTGITVAVNVLTGSFDGEFTDWLLRSNYRRELLQTEEKQVLRICNIPEDKLSMIEAFLTRIGVNYSVIK